MHLRENVSLAPYTTLSIGGPARWLAEIATESDLLEALTFARDHLLPIQILGGGSNVLIADAGYNGLILHIGLRGITEHNSTLEVAAGEEWDPVVAYAVERNLAGIECLSGIPGRTGGTPVQNVGAYGQEVSQTITHVRVYDRNSANFVTLTNADCGFAYRTSIFNTTARDRFIVTSVTFALTPNGAPNLSYADLQQHFAWRNAQPTLAEVRKAVRNIRHRKGMLIVPGDPDARSAGSFFRNPIVATETHHQLSQRYGTVPCYTVNDQQVKIPAAWLVEHAGFNKGYTLGPAGVSSKHTLALINRNHAAAADIIALRNQITQTVQTKFQIHLEPEPVYID